ncbi:M50 family metallopeptidase [Tomitella cavernea]|uniref:Zinc metalloprotease Rip1 n=1 Tax=Tomitella cavernea TaxID=1387982 RepID=A0ABP9CRL3_9ACTN|nr:site-2 protease family protein [Tomitella cavernea]
MDFVLGVILFAFGIGVSIALHEFGHLGAAKMFGMKVRRYFIGFGPKIFSFRRGETEYGLKAVPAGGFCDIAGMTAMDELAPDEAARAMFRFPAWKRIVVMLAGVVMNILIGLVLIYGLALGSGLPQINAPQTKLGALSCSSPVQRADGTLVPCTGTGPAQQAGLESGDVVKRIDGTAVETWPDLVAAVRDSSGTVPFVVERDGETLTIPVQVEQVQRQVTDPSTGAQRSETVGAIGAGRSVAELDQFNALTAVPGSLEFTGEIAVLSWNALLDFPSRVPNLVESIFGGQRSDETPMSVVGASRLGGEFVERDLWQPFVLLLAQLNFFLALLNVLPLLPFDGGHIAVVIYEKIRDAVRRLRGKAAGAPVDYMKLMPVTLAIAVVLGGFMLLTVTADIVNPIRVF